MLKKLKSKIKLFLYKEKGIQIRKLVDYRINGKKFTVINGTTYNKPEIDSAWCDALAKNSKIVFDVGANKGQNAMIMLSNDNIEKFVVIDPSPEALSLATENFIRNSLIQKVSIYCCFASNKNDENIQFWSSIADASGSMFASMATTAKNNNQFTYVPTKTIDFISDYFNLIPDLIKMDIEGAELIALEGCKNIFSKQKTTFIVEMHSNPGVTNKEFLQKLLDICKENNYTAWYLKDKCKITDASITGGRNRYHVLLLPQNQEFPEYLNKIDEKQVF